MYGYLVGAGTCLLLAAYVYVGMRLFMRLYRMHKELGALMGAVAFAVWLFLPIWVGGMVVAFNY